MEHHDTTHILGWLALASLVPVLALAVSWTTGTVSTRVQESREQTAQRQRDAARRALRDMVQSAFDGALEDVDMRRLQDVLLQMGTAEPSTCEEISAIGHL